MDPDLLASWKEDYGQIYSLSHRGKEYIFRAATFKEYRVAGTPHGEDWSTADGEDTLVEACLLSPRENFDRLPAGLISSLCEEIRQVSGHGSPQWSAEVLKTKRDEAQGVEHLMKAFVIATMPSYKDTDLENLTYQQLAEKVALAEQIIKVQQAVASGGQVALEIIDPEEEAAKEEAERTKHATSRKPGQAGYDDPVAQKLRQALG